MNWIAAMMAAWAAVYVMTGLLVIATGMVIRRGSARMAEAERLDVAEAQYNEWLARGDEPGEDGAA